MAGEVIARFLADAKGREIDKTDLLYGRVTRVSPLEIEVEGRFKISSEFIVLSQMVKDYTVTAEMPSGDEEIKINIFRALRAGDKVSMLRVRKGQAYYVLERR